MERHGLCGIVPLNLGTKTLVYINLLSVRILEDQGVIGFVADSDIYDDCMFSVVDYKVWSKAGAIFQLEAGFDSHMPPHATTFIRQKPENSVVSLIPGPEGARTTTKDVRQGFLPRCSQYPSAFQPTVT